MVDMDFLVFSRALYLPPVSKVFFEARKVPQMMFFCAGNFWDVGNFLLLPTSNSSDFWIGTFCQLYRQGSLCVY